MDDWRRMAFYKVSVDAEDNNTHEEDFFDQNRAGDDAGEGADDTAADGDDADFTDQDEQDENDDLFDLSYAELSEVLPGGADEALEIVCLTAERTLAVLHQLREEDPEATVHGQAIDELIAQLESLLARSKASQQALEQSLHHKTECFAAMCLEKATFPFPFWSFAATVGRCWYPAHSQVQVYFDLDDLRRYLATREPDPIHLLN